MSATAEGSASKMVLSLNCGQETSGPHLWASPELLECLYDMAFDFLRMSDANKGSVEAKISFMTY